MSVRSTHVFAMAALMAVNACGNQAGEIVQPGSNGHVQARTGTVIVNGCPLDNEQTMTLATPAAHAVVQEVVLLCLTIESNGNVLPSDRDGQGALRDQVQAIQAMGYRVSLAFSQGDTTSVMYEPAQASALLASNAWRVTAIDQLGAYPVASDGFDIAFPQLQNTATTDLNRFVASVSSVVRSTRKLNIWVPPSIASPSDVPGGDAYELTTLNPLVDQVRVMTLDFSCCGAPPGPTTDSGWAVDAARFAIAESGTTPLQISVPLYGNDFGVIPNSVSTTYADALALATLYNATPRREATGVLHFDYLDAQSIAHQVWYDDAETTRRTLSAWDSSVLPVSVGVVYWGLGAEDPMLWSTIATAMQPQGATP